MRVVELDHNLGGEGVPVLVAEPEPADDVAQRARDQEVLLLQAQLATGGRAVVGVEHLADVLRAHDVLDRLAVLSRREPGQVEREPAGPRTPQPDDVHRFGAVPGHQHVTGLAAHRLAGYPAAPQAGAVVVDRLGVSVVADELTVVGCPELPRVVVERPLVGQLDLGAVPEGLPEDAELVADAVADCRDIHGGERVEQAGRQPPQAAVAQPRFEVQLRQLLVGQPEPAHRPPGEVLRARVEEILLQLPAEQVLGGQVVDEPRVGLVVRSRGPDAAIDQPVANREGQRLVGVMGTRRLQRRALMEIQILEQATLEVACADADRTPVRPHGHHQTPSTAREAMCTAGRGSEGPE